MQSHAWIRFACHNVFSLVVKLGIILIRACIFIATSLNKPGFRCYEVNANVASNSLARGGGHGRTDARSCDYKFVVRPLAARVLFKLKIFLWDTTVLKQQEVAAFYYDYYCLLRFLISEDLTVFLCEGINWVLFKCCLSKLLLPILKH